MFDIVSCEAEPSNHGFKGFYRREQLAVEEADNLAAATKLKNKRTLIMLSDHSFDEGAVKVIAEKKKACFLIDLGQLIRSKGVQRAILMSKLRLFLSHCNRHGAFYAFASFARSEAAVRTPEELIRIAMLLGVNRGQARFALEMLGHYVP